MVRTLVKSSTVLALGITFVAMFTVWSMYLMQTQLVELVVNVAYLNHTVRDLESYVRWKSQVNREYMISYINSKQPAEIKQWYSFSQTEVDTLNNLPQDSPELVEHIRRNLLIPPPLIVEKREPQDTSKGQAKKILQHFGGKRNGVFIECGANDGSFLSNTYWLETAHNWTGLLIEAEPNNFKNLLKKNRNAWLLPACLSPHKHASMVAMEQAGAWAKIKANSSSNEMNTVHCMPLLSILLALNQTIDYFSLDIEGHELAVLRTLPFDKIDVKTWSIEHSNVKEGHMKLFDFMIAQGYESMPSTEEEKSQWAHEDYIFTKKEYFTNAGETTPAAPTV